MLRLDDESFLASAPSKKAGFRAHTLEHLPACKGQVRGRGVRGERALYGGVCVRELEKLVVV